MRKKYMTLAEFARIHHIPHDDRRKFSKAAEMMIGPILKRASDAILLNQGNQPKRRSSR